MKVLNWFKNGGWNIILMFLLSITIIAKEILVLVDIFANSDSITAWIKALGDFEAKLSAKDGSEDAK